ncbi:MAG TPA: DUF3093 domain-containing protein [Streptosporangiaceae bacterium]
MRVYHERLGVPLHWWLVVTACVVLLGSMLWAGFSLTIAAVTYAGLEAIAAAILAAWSTARIEVGPDALAAGRHRLPLSQVAGASPLDRAQTAALRGPRADPAAVLLVRPWLPRAVYVEVTGRPASQPYWLLATRRPDELAAAIEQARAGAGADCRSGHAGGGDAAQPAPGAVG